MLQKGTILGYCNGYFGRDKHYDKIVEHIGEDYIVVRGLRSRELHILQGDIIHNIPIEWLREDDDEV